MKLLQKFSILAPYLLLLLTSCDPEICGKSTFVNNSNHSISILTYQDGQVLPDMSISGSLPPEGRFTLAASSCYIGWTVPPFSNGWRHDSIVLIFNDTLRVLLFSGTMPPQLFGAKNPLVTDWKETKRIEDGGGATVYYEYEFTNWHFEQAVAFSR